MKEYDHLDGDVGRRVDPVGGDFATAVEFGDLFNCHRASRRRLDELADNRVAGKYKPR